MPEITTEDLITTHLGLVARITRSTATRVPAHVSRDDLNSAGLAALVQAAHAFDPERGTPFAAYAATRIRGALLDELRSADWATRSVRRRAREVEQARARLAGTLGRIPTADEVAETLGVDPAQVAGSDDQVARATVLSLGGTPWGDLPSEDRSPEHAVEHREKLEYLFAAVAELPPRLRLVVREYFLAERPMAEIAARLGVSESRVSQLRATALTLLRDALNHALDPDLVPPPSRPGGCVDRRRAAYFDAVCNRHAGRAG